MNIRATKEAWQKATRIVNNAAGKGNEDEIRTHFVFRVSASGTGIEVLASNGLRLLASAPIEGAEVEGTPGETCTAPAGRVLKLIGGLRDGREITLDSSGGSGVVSFVTKGKGGRDSVGRMVALDPKAQRFPFWDDSLSSSKEIGTVTTASLATALGYSRQFASKEESRTPNLVATEARDGVLNSTNAAAVCLIGLGDALAESKMRINGTDMAVAASFLNGKDSEKIVIRETDQCVYFQYEKGGPDDLRPTLGISKWPKEVPPLRVDRDAPDTCSFAVSLADLQEGVAFLEACAKSENTYLHFRIDGDELVMGMTSASGADGNDEWRVDVRDQKDLDKLSEGGHEGFALNRIYFQQVADFIGKSTPDTSQGGALVRFGMNWTPKNGYTRFRLERDGFDYLTLLIWLRQKK